jgi:hypothetical protein
MSDPKSDFRRGDAITAEWANAVSEATGIRIKTGAGLASRKGRGTIQITSTSPKGIGSLAKSTSTFNIAAGTTPGSGTLDLYYMDESGPTARTTGESVSAYTMATKAQSSGKAIDSGQWCWAEQDRFGIWFTMPLECI